VLAGSRLSECLITGLLLLPPQVFAQPIFETAEKWVVEAKLGIAQHPALMRALVRCSYVAATCAVAILVPFFNDINGHAHHPPAPCACTSGHAWLHAYGCMPCHCIDSASCC
jgi:hypothetical protein